MAENFFSGPSQTDFGGGLPPEFQKRIDDASRQRRIADMLMAMAAKNYAPQQQGRIASRSSPLSALVPALTGFLGQRKDNEVRDEYGKIRSDFQSAEQKAVQDFQALPPDQQDQQSTTSQFNRVRDIGKALQAQRMKQAEGAVGIIKDRDPMEALRINKTGVLSPEGYKIPEPAAPSFMTSPAGNEVLVTKNLKGEADAKYRPAPAAVVHNNLPGTEGRAALDFFKEDLTARQKPAAIAKEVLTSNTRAVDALESGAKSGGLEGIRQGLRKGLQGFGIDLPDTAPTEQLQMAMGQAVLDQARKLAPVTENDIKMLEKVIGSVNTDPTALTKAIAYTNAIAIRGLADYGQYVDNQSSNITQPEARSLFSGAKIGYDLPQQLSGPIAFQMETVRNLKNQGFDISKLRDPTGQPFDRNSTFNIDPTAGFKGVNPESMSPASMPEGFDKLTPAQQARYKQLKGLK